MEAREGDLRIALKATVTGDRLTLDFATDSSVVLRSPRTKYELSQLVSRITANNRHSETDWGPPAGHGPIPSPRNRLRRLHRPRGRTSRPAAASR